MWRKALQSLEEWHGRPASRRKPLVIRGARQVGKSYLVRDFARRNGLTLLELNLEKEPDLARLLRPPDAKTRQRVLEAHFRQPLGEKTLLFLDEIQAAPEVFSRLRYLHEDMPDLRVLAAGSLLEFALAEIEHSVPVGRVEYLHLGPMDFEELLFARGDGAWVELLRAWKPGDAGVQAAVEPFHGRLLEAVRDYGWVGGMPEAVSCYAQERDFLAIERVHRSTLDSFREDFAKYRRRVPLERLQRLFVEIPAQLGRKWVHARVEPGARAEAVNSALGALCAARVAHRVCHSSGNGIPLAAERKERSFKVLFLDVGLAGAQLGLRITDLAGAEALFRVNEGALAEQWIGQHLLDLRPAYAAPELYHWAREKRGSEAEVDFLWAHGARVVPVEVKAGKRGKLKSLRVFMDEKRSKLGVRFSTLLPSLEGNVLHLPFYLVEELPRLAEGLG
ncbi:MAG: ATP-binding protein [Planctomycetes bacterium]|nr:ATP-binding protein [Planctomycetota bacterium]